MTSTSATAETTNVRNFIASPPLHSSRHPFGTLRQKPSPGGDGPSIRRTTDAVAEKTFAAALDQGTTGTRFMIFTHDGQVRARAYQEHTQHYPQPGWVEHDPLEIWE